MLQLCLRLPKLLLQARQFQLLPFGPLLELHALLAPPLEIFGQPLALLPQAPPFFLQALGFLLSCKALLSFCLELFY
jgi:hypothetical protein